MTCPLLSRPVVLKEGTTPYLLTLRCGMILQVTSLCKLDISVDFVMEWTCELVIVRFPVITLASRSFSFLIGSLQFRKNVAIVADLNGERNPASLHYTKLAVTFMACLRPTV